MARPLRIVTTGLAATYPFGGVFWDYLQYPLGLRRLGHEVLYVEDTGRWCYDAAAATFVESAAENAAGLARALTALDPGLADRWFVRDAAGATYGRDWRQVAAFCRSADLFLHISASCWMREEYFAAARVAFVDTDPLYTQASIPAYLAGTVDAGGRERVEMLRRHDVFFTFAENVDGPDCRIPTGLFRWIPTRQPVVLDCFRAAVPVRARRPVLTTVASWEAARGSELIVGGVRYGGKAVEFERFIDLPRRSPLPIEVALSGAAPVDRLRAHGWRLVDGYRVSRDPWVYREFLSHSLGELSVAKHAYVASRSGWFSCRTACYLALGVPAIVQDTGFRARIPDGDGLFAFADADEAVEAARRVEAEPEAQAKAARALAEEHFDSGRVLGDLLAHALG